MTYGLAVREIGNSQFIQISPDEFRAIKTAKTNLLVALAIEEKFEILVQNYSEYERALLDLAFQRIIHQGCPAFADDRQLLNRRIANVVMASRMYIEQTKGDIAEIYGSTSAAREAFSREYDRSLGYRVMEAVRNHVQHQSLPVGALMYPSERQQEDGGDQFRFGVEPQLDLDAVRNNPRFKPSVLAEVESDPAALDLTLMIRQSVEGLSRVHGTIRDLTRQDVEVWTATLDKAVERAQTELKSTATPVAVRRDDDGHYCEKVYLVAHIAERSQRVRERYKNLNFLSHCYVSSETGTVRKSRWRPVPC